MEEKCKPIGRPIISEKVKALIRSIHSENPLLSPEKIREMLLIMNYTEVPSANKIREIIGRNNKKPPTEKQIQPWKTFLKIIRKYGQQTFVVPTLTFRMLYVLIVINHDTRKIEHFGVTYNPNSPNSIWLIQQFREATPYDYKPIYLIHDNDPVFRSKDFQGFLDSYEIKSKRTAYRSPWQNGICERVIGSIRRELTDHIIPINEKHLHRLLKEYVGDYYNTHRTHQGIECKTPIPTKNMKSLRFMNLK